MSTLDTHAGLQYLVPTGEKPIYIASTGGADARMNIGADFETRDVPILDARHHLPQARLNTQGFCLRPHPLAGRDFYQLNEFQADYEAEITQLVLDSIDATSALVFDHTLRSDSPAIRGEHLTREPAAVIHNDYSDASALKRLRDMLPTNEAEQRASQRFAIINVWRSIGGDIWNSPMTLCDADTIDKHDLVASERRAAERIGELELVSWNPRHRWYYYPLMTEDEVLLIKTFDAQLEGVARRSIHTAFDNPLAGPDKPPRQSIESRLMVFFD